MKRLFKRAVTGLLLGGIVVLGGGFASADYADGDAPATASATVTYTVASFRAIELTSTTVAFGTVRQGGTAMRPGPTVLYGTTWTGDKISVYLGTAMANGVKLYIVPGAPTSPSSSASGDPCTSVGVTAAATVTVTSTQSATPQALVTGITNCGYPQTTGSAVSSSPGNYPSGTPVLTPTATSWASVATTLYLDTSLATDGGTPGALATPQSKTLYFVIND